MLGFVEICPLVPELFEGFLPYMGMVAILDFLYTCRFTLKMLNLKFGFDWPSSFRG